MILKTDTMENTVGFEQGSTYMQFSDLDKDNEIEVEIMTNESDINIWLNDKDIIKLKEHLDYIISKF